jgi:transcriptional regulator with XRE-family HTH domain
MLPPAIPACFKMGMARGRSRKAKDMLGRNTVRLRRSRALSQAELAARAKVTQALVSAIELARANPTLESLDRLAQALQVSLLELFSE